MASYTYMRKFGRPMDHSRYDYSADDYFTHLTVRHITMPAYRLFGGKKHPWISNTAVDAASIGAYALMFSPVGLCALVWALYDRHKHEKRQLHTPLFSET